MLWQNLRKGLALMDGPTRLRWSLLIGFSVIAALMEAAGAIVILSLINAVNNISSLSKLPLIGSALESFAQQHGAVTIVYLAVICGVFFVVKNLFLVFQTYYQERCAVSSAVQTSSRLLEAYLRAPYEFHFGRNSARMIRAIEDSVDIVYRTVMLSAVVITTETLTVVALLAVPVTAEPVVTLVTASTLGVMMAITLKLLQHRFAAWGERRLAMTRNLLQTIQQSLGSIKETKVLGRENYFVDAFAEAAAHRGAVLQRVAAFAQAPRLIVETVMVCAMLMIMGLVMLQRESTAIFPVLGLFAYVGFRAMPSVNRLIMQLNNIRYGTAAIDEVYDDYNLISQLNVPHREAKRPDRPAPFTREIRLENVTYTYPGRQTPALQSVNVTIRRGTAVGIAGATGAGKSTLADIVLALLAPSTGRVLVDGIDVAADPRSWLHHVGYVPQSIFLSDDTLRRNIAIGRSDSEIDDDAIRRAAGMARILEFIEALPAGFDTVVGERGVKLSGGQRQRLGIARALYHEPDVLIFDEATSSLDNETEAEITRAIDTLAGAKTLVIIAHRLSTLRHCGKILFLKEGRLVAEGSYPELLVQNEDFNRMVSAGGIATAET